MSSAGCWQWHGPLAIFRAGDRAPTNGGTADMERGHYTELLRAARRVSRRPEEAEDLLHNALLAALAAGRTAPTRENRSWIEGVLRNQARLVARHAVRARRRDGTWLRCQPEVAGEPEAPTDSTPTIMRLPRSLRIVALLALSEHTRAEIRYLLRLSDQSLRQRVSQLKRRWIDACGQDAVPTPQFPHGLATGRIRSSLLPMAKLLGSRLASHDPDGHLFAIESAHKMATHKMPGHGNVGGDGTRRNMT
jgi:DNA-directed RNA polymerase specialized sigma24 family protein